MTKAQGDNQVGVPRAFQPLDPMALNDQGADRATRSAKPCLRRINHANVSRFETSVSWCLLESGHSGQCSGPLPTILEPEKPERGRKR